MQMAGPDIVLLVVGALLSGGATYVIVTSDSGLTGQTSPLGVFDVSFSTTQEEIVDQAVGDLRSGSAEFVLDDTRTLAVVVTIECTDLPAGAAAPFQIQVQVAGPNGTTADGSGACGQGVVVDVPLADVPAATSVPGTTEADAAAALDASVPENVTRALGAWTVTVSGGRQGAPVAIPAGNPGGAIVVAIEKWEPRFSAIPR